MYYVYEDWEAKQDQGIVHAGTCAVCNNGQGFAGGKRDGDGIWHGPFQTVDEAKSAIDSCHRLSVHECVRIALLGQAGRGPDVDRTV